MNICTLICKDQQDCLHSFNIFNQKKAIYGKKNPKSSKDRQDRQDRHLVILGDLDDLC